MTAKEKNETSSYWTFEQEKAFEIAVATHPESCEDWFERIACDVPGKTLEEVKHHYSLLVEDISRIDSGCIPLPNYSSSSEGSTSQAAEEGSGKKGSGHSGESNHGGKGSRADQERRKGIAWTEDEHRLFLLGLDKYGKGDWRSISRNFVVTRTPTQVASHAQKYFIRLNSMNKDRRRSSIHDITSINGELASTQGPITGQNTTFTGAPAATGGAAATEKPAVTKQLPVQHHPVATGPIPGLGVYGTPTIGQPIGGHLGSAVGTPVILPPPQMAYGMRAPVPGAMVPGAPINMGAMAYPMHHPSAHM